RYLLLLARFRNGRWLRRWFRSRLGAVPSYTFELVSHRANLRFEFLGNSLSFFTAANHSRSDQHDELGAPRIIGRGAEEPADHGYIHKIWNSRATLAFPFTNKPADNQRLTIVNHPRSLGVLGIERRKSILPDQNIVAASANFRFDLQIYESP